MGGNGRVQVLAASASSPGGVEAGGAWPVFHKGSERSGRSRGPGTHKQNYGWPFLPSDLRYERSTGGNAAAACGMIWAPKRHAEITFTDGGGDAHDRGFLLRQVRRCRGLACLVEGPRKGCWI